MDVYFLVDDVYTNAFICYVLHLYYEVATFIQSNNVFMSLFIVSKRSPKCGFCRTKVLGCTIYVIVY